MISFVFAESAIAFLASCLGRLLLSGSKLKKSPPPVVQGDEKITQRFA